MPLTPSFFNEAKGVHDCFRGTFALWALATTANKGQEWPSWIIKDWPQLKSSMVKQAELICHTLLMEMDTSTRIKRQLKDSTHQRSQEMGMASVSAFVAAVVM